MTRSNIGFIGLGLMGQGMAANILRKGWPLFVMAHRNRAPVEALVAEGAKEAKSPREMAENCDIIVLCVTGSPEVLSVMGGPDGIASAGRPVTIIDCSTSDPSVTTKLAADVAESGLTLIDAPLSRTPADAAAGTLDVMVGGAEDDVQRIWPVLECFAGRIIHTGPTGSGHTMKLLNNFVSMGYAALYSEALMLGRKAGLTPEVFDSVIRGGRMDCPFYQTFFRWVLERDPNAHKFAIRNAFKDMSYLAGYANAAGVANPIGAAVRNSFAQAVGAGRGEDYVPMLSDFIAESNGLE
ncbi:3-hydroxyisobutyrate dehydrogenase [Sinorhizobium medicae]|uniref:3-hydroxyisobutyrate dehydrogenase n=1 Tax=Sinorhizobium medicae TaxID=110321 RepID=A0A508X222_9HYPH|nr:NAD(P)-dependent oxidoreductase [Sinorhizobium medicae]MBO1961787.1 NAD(P)-dependent oxidoreductase [Sinorhizobium medicae]MDX0452167.1 NAD-binding protein [Sinorhizobium medicae]MDX0513473.1 NAD-binding protein [Sinorhizobium medicae]MDX0520299.1 NAD-binding protein [Sinorhizobium medicae]MDX0631241.1 NAD-binding protein [Sinorhizobium medicae]